MENDNITAISTAQVASGVAVIRISGSSPLSIAEKMFSPTGKTSVLNFEPNKMYAGEIDAGSFKDYGMCVYFKAPKSFTGEDTVEFHTHGGLAITRGILKHILSLGVRMAGNGEFTKRAFMNGKLSLASAEGLIDMINSESESAVKAGYSLYREKLTSTVTDMQKLLTEAISGIDVDIDFPEENLDKVSLSLVEKSLFEVKESIEKLLNTFKIGRVVKNGVKVGIVGKPNTGKSSLLNALLNYDKAIVSSLAGTTRDIVEGSIDINGVRFNFSDTAGIRESSDKIESLGVNLSKKIIEESDLIILVLDGLNINKEDDELYELVKDKNLLTVLNKTDKTDNKDKRAEVYISALNKVNIDLLSDKIYDKTVGAGIDLNGDFLLEERHFIALSTAKEKIESAISAIGKVPLDILAIDVKSAWDYLGEISGTTATEDIINDIFSRFCVGK